jgi:hypothetical protein
VLALLVLMTPVLIGSAGFAIDLSNLMLRRTAAQNAADLAALAAAAKLPDDVDGALAAARRAAAANHFVDNVNGVQVTVTAPFGSDSSQVQLTIQDSVPTYFMRLLGQPAAIMHVRAVAQKPPARYGVFATNSGCGSAPGSVVWTMSGSRIEIPVYSGADFRLTGSSNRILGGITYACSSSIVGSGNTFSPAPARGTSPAPPIVHPESDLAPCTFQFAGTQDLMNSGPWWVGGSSASGQLKPGVYCATGDLRMTGVGVRGTVTFVAHNAITLTGSNFNLQPYKDHVLFAAYGSGTTSVTGAGGTLSGYIYVPNGTLQFTGSGNAVVSGGLVAAGITITGSATTFTNGAGDSQRPPVLIK